MRAPSLAEFLRWRDYVGSHGAHTLREAATLRQNSGRSVSVCGPLRASAHTQHTFLPDLFSPPLPPLPCPTLIVTLIDSM